MTTENDANATMAADVADLLNDTPPAEPQAPPTPPAPEPPANPPEPPPQPGEPSSLTPPGESPAPEPPLDPQGAQALVQPEPPVAPAPPVPPAPPVQPAAPEPPASPQLTVEEQLAESRNIINQMAATIMALQNGAQAAPGAQAPIPPQPASGPQGAQAPVPAPGTQAPVPPQPMQPFEFVKTEEEMDELFKTKEGFNKLLTGVMYKSVESMMRVVPKLVSTLADQQITTRSAITEFYSNNKDLIPSKAYVGMVADELVAHHPDWTMDKLFGELGKEVRTRLKMVGGGAQAPIPPQGPTPPQPPQPPQGPAFAGTGGAGGRGGGAPQSSLQKEIDELAEF